MTATNLSTPMTTATTVRPARPARPAGGSRVVSALGGVALSVAPVLCVIGMYTSPPQDSASNVDYVESMARAPFRAALSANFLHYAWVLLAVGVLAIVPLLRGRRGRFASSAAIVVTALSSIQLSGLLLSDFYVVRMAQENGIAAAARVGFDLGTSADVWMQTGRIAALMVPVLIGCLAFSRIVSWWLVLVFVVGVGVMFLPLPALVAAPIMVAGFAPLFSVAGQLITGRTRGA